MSWRNSWNHPAFGCEFSCREDGGAIKLRAQVGKVQCVLWKQGHNPVHPRALIQVSDIYHRQENRKTGLRHGGYMNRAMIRVMGNSDV
jgi:hypothetical protein